MKFRQRTIISMVIMFLVCFFVGANGAKAVYGGFAQDAPPSDVDQAIEEAFRAVTQTNQERMPALMMYDVVIDHIQYSNDGATALLWLGMRDLQTGTLLETEPGLSIARSANPALVTSAANWSVAMPVDETWLDQLRSLPPELLTEDIQNHVLSAEYNAEALRAAGVFNGYKLPWAAGLAKRITNSIGHVMSVSGGLTSCPATCRFAYDFADGTMFPILAAKGGTVKAFRTTCANGDTNCTNYFVLEDQSTIPTSYQLYYHMAFNSIPQRLRVIGTPVMQGEYIGDADDTGFSTGHHLHYHVFTSANSANWSWGPSVNFIFDDVTTNGGVPRTCNEAAEYPKLGGQCMTGNRYISGNTPAHPPAASLTTPVDRQMITTRTVRVAGTATDNISIARIQVQANYDGTWKTIDDITPPAGTGGAFSKDVDLCTAKVPDGPLALTVNVFDREGSRAAGIPVLQVLKSASCTTTAAPPQLVTIAAPGENDLLSNAPTTIIVAALDRDGGNVAQVDFFWHSGDWSIPQWTRLGSDTTPADGWSWRITPSQLGVLENAAIYVQARGKQGGMLGAVRWHLAVDQETPATQLLSLASVSNSTVIDLNWVVQDGQGDITEFEIQYQTKNGDTWTDWQDWSQEIPPSARSAFFVGQPGTSLRFRMRAIDAAGHIEAYDDAPEAETTIAATCVPDAQEVKGYSLETSLALGPSASSPSLNLCRSGPTGADDVDWLTIQAVSGKPLFVKVVSLGGNAAFRTSLYNAAREQIASWDSENFNQPVIKKLDAPAPGVYYLEVRPLQPELFGTDVRYQVSYAHQEKLHIPFIWNVPYP